MIDVLKRWAWVALVAVIGAVLYLLTIGRVKVNVAAEVAAAKADAEVVKIQAEHDYETVMKHIEKKYADTIEMLTKGQEIEADLLRNDPRKLAQFLARAGAGA